MGMNRGKLNKKGLKEEITGRENGRLLGKEGEHREKEIVIERRRILGEKEEIGLETVTMAGIRGE
jgi:hypothetical protein